MKGGKWNGYGTRTCANGNKYVGQFKNDKYHGNGTFTGANGSKYIGKWRDDKMHGQGILIAPDGTVCSYSEWENGKPKNVS